MSHSQHQMEFVRMGPGIRQFPSVIQQFGSQSLFFFWRRVSWKTVAGYRIYVRFLWSSATAAGAHWPHLLPPRGVKNHNHTMGQAQNFLQNTLYVIDFGFVAVLTQLSSNGVRTSWCATTRGRPEQTHSWT